MKKININRKLKPNQKLKTKKNQLRAKRRDVQYKNTMANEQTKKDDQAALEQKAFERQLEANAK